MTAALVAAFGVNLALAVLNAALYAQDTSRWWNLAAACLSGGVAAYGLVVLGRSR